MALRFLFLLLVLLPFSARAQSVILQSGTITPGDFPQYVNSNSLQPVVKDSGISALSNGIPSATTSQIYCGTGSAGLAAACSTLPSSVQLGITQTGTITTGTWQASPILPGYGGVSGLTGYVYANGSSAATASTTIPSSAVKTTGRTVTGTTDTITTADDGGIVTYNAGSSNVAVTLPCGTALMQTQVYETKASTGTVTFTAASTACSLNGTSNGQISISVHTPYTLSVDNQPGTAAEWGLK